MKTKRALTSDEAWSRAEIAADLISAEAGIRWDILGMGNPNEPEKRFVKFARTDGVHAGVFELTNADLSANDWKDQVVLKFNKWSTELLSDDDETTGDKPQLGEPDVKVITADSSEQERIVAILQERTAAAQRNGHDTLQAEYTLSAISEIASLMTTGAGLGPTRWGWGRVLERDQFIWEMKFDVGAYDIFDRDHPPRFLLNGQVVQRIADWQEWEDGYPATGIEAIRREVLAIVEGERARHEAQQDEHAPITFEQAAEAARGAVEATKESQRKRHHNESVALVTEMVAGAGFEKIYHQGDQFIIWQQILPARTNVKVTLALTFDELQKPPAEIFRLVFDQVGAK